MNPADPTDLQGEGERLLSAVERLVEDADTLISHVEAFKFESTPEGEVSEPEALRAVADHIIRTYSTKSALTGGLSALPAILPGLGTAIGVVGGSLADVAFMLKYEVEMVLCLTHLYGHDIREEKARWLAYLLATVHTHTAKSQRNYFVDLAEAEIEALAKYTPRQLSKLVVTVMGKLALETFAKRLIRVVPLLGIVVGASANKLLTSTVGWRCVAALASGLNAETDDEELLVDATVN